MRIARNNISNRFELVILGTQRAKDISLGIPTLIQHKTKDKETVLALREIAAGVIDCDKLRDLVISKQLNLAQNERKNIKHDTVDMNSIFKELALSVDENDNNFLDEEDGYENDTTYETDDCCEVMAREDEDDDCDLEDDIEEKYVKPNKTPPKEFNIDITYDDVEE